MKNISVLIKPASGACNMTCDYCFYCDEAAKREQKFYGMMSEETLKNMIRRTMLHSEGSVSYTWQGGEPTLRGLDFFRKALYLQKKYNRNHLQVINAFQTNGYGITDDWCMFFKENKFLVGVSVDGLPEIHDSIRHNKIGDGTFEQINKNIKLLDKYNVEYNILTVVTPKVAKNIKSIYAFYKQRGWHYQQYIACLDPYGEEHGKMSYSILPEQYGKFLVVLVVGILLIYPIFSSLYYSMTTKHLIRLTYDFIGLENYKAVLADPNFFKAFLNSVLWTLGSLAGQLIIGFTGALAINRVNFGKGIYRTLMIIPWAFPSIVIALSWKWILNGVSGFIPNILVQLGICNELPQFLSDNSFVFLTLIFINIWFGAPMIMVNVLSALQTIPQDQYEAAQIDGASKVQQFWYITVPHIKVVVGLLVVLRTIWVFNNFDIIYLLTGGGPANATTTMPIYAYNMGWNTKLLGRSSAVTMLLLAFLLLVCVIYFTIIGKWEKEDK